MVHEGLPWWLSGRESACPCRRHRLHPWVRKIPRRRAWKPTPVLSPGESRGQRSLVGCSPWGCKELDMTERLSMHSLTHARMACEILVLRPGISPHPLRGTPRGVTAQAIPGLSHPEQVFRETRWQEALPAALGPPQGQVSGLPRAWPWTEWALAAWELSELAAGSCQRGLKTGRPVL